MKIEVGEKGELYWATDIERDIVYINSLKNAEVVNFFMSIYQDMDEIKTDEISTNMCNNENILVDKPTGKSFDSHNNEAFISHPGDKDQISQFLLTTTEIVDPVVEAIRKSPEQDIQLQNLSPKETISLPQVATESINLKANSAYEINKSSQ